MRAVSTAACCSGAGMGRPHLVKGVVEDLPVGRALAAIELFVAHRAPGQGVRREGEECMRSLEVQNFTHSQALSCAWTSS